MRTLILVLLLAFTSPLLAREVNVQTVSASDSTAAKLTEQIEPAFEHVEIKTGLADDGPITLVVVGGKDSFAEVAGRDGVSMNAESVLGYAQPGQRRLVLNLGGIRERGLEPIGVLRHEIAHLVMGSQLRVQRPLWFEEGVAQYVESVAMNELRESVGANPWIDFGDFADLDRALREEARSGVAYTESREVIRLMIQRHGEDKFAAFMRKLAAGDGPFEKAFEDATGERIEKFEQAWLKDRESRAGDRLAGFLGGAFWWLLLGATALMLPLFWVLLRRRGKSQVDRWEEQEEYFPSDPSWSYTDDEPEGYTPEDPNAWKR